MKYFLSFGILFFSILISLSAQGLQSSTSIDNADLGYTYIVGRVENRTFVLSRKASRFRGDYYITAFDALGLGQLWQRETALGKNVEQVLKVWANEGVLHLLVHEYDKGQSDVRYLKYNTEGQIIYTKSIFSIDAKSAFNADNEIQLSQDFSKVAIASNWTKSKNWLAVYDLKNDYLLWSSQSKISIEKDENVNIKSLSLANNGDAFLILEDKQDETYIYHIKAEESAPLVYTIGTKDIPITSIKAAFNNESQALHLAFFLQQRGDYAYALQYLCLDNTGALFKDKKVFDANFILQAIGKKSMAKKGIYALDIKNIQFYKDEVLIIGEQFRRTTRTTSLNGIDDSFYFNRYDYLRARNNNTEYEYWYGALAVFKYKNNVLSQEQSIRKEQISYNDNGLLSSFVLAEEEGNYTFMYNSSSRSKSQLEIFKLNTDKTITNTIVPFPRNIQEISNKWYSNFSNKAIYILAVDNSYMYLLKVNLNKAAEYVEEE